MSWVAIELRIQNPKITKAPFTAPSHNAKQGIPDETLLDNINQQVIHSANAANGVLRTVENGILSDKLSGLAKKNELSTLQNLDGKIIVPREDQIDGILRQNFQKTIPQRLGLITSTIIGEVISQKTDTVALNSFSNRIPQSVDDVLPEASLTNISRRADSFLSRRPGGTFDGGFKPATGTICRKPPLSQRLNLTSVAYDYPQ
ncbi:hypothetical protein PoB_000801800 [Plakobranchus ocellatus]|uniref:Uncharacterized protein n=1 Tax=Plakobranchus ocellatus TaxID=259542 RepID=A0AAV3YG74_9GAST|nr:hypothetical protein PoB_000801800 [Plakobranchus ocellatus]